MHLACTPAYEYCSHVHVACTVHEVKRSGRTHIIPLAVFSNQYQAPGVLPLVLLGDTYNILVPGNTRAEQLQLCVRYGTGRVDGGHARSRKQQ